jgi:hypothetical protein
MNTIIVEIQFLIYVNLKCLANIKLISLQIIYEMIINGNGTIAMNNVDKLYLSTVS